MVRISRSVEYALVALQHLEAKGPHEVSSARDISEEYNLPSGLVAKLLQRLAAHGIARSEQGPRGGYSLCCDLDSVTLYEVIEAVEGPQHFTACRTGDMESCDRAGDCSVSQSVGLIGDRISGLLSSITVSELLSANSPPGGADDVGNVQRVEAGTRR